MFEREEKRRTESEKVREKEERTKVKKNSCSYQGHPPRVRCPKPLDPRPAQHCGPPAAPADAAEGPVAKLKGRTNREVFLEGWFW